jgi:hypothetical protein
MCEIKNDYKIIIVFIFLVFICGCSSKYLSHTEEDLLEREIFASWEELECEIIVCDNQGFSLGVQVKDFDVVREHLSVKEIYKYGYGDPEKKTIPAFWGLVVGCAGCFFGYKIGAESDENYVPSLLFPNPSEQGCAIACLFALPGFVMMADGLRKGNEYTKIIPDYIKIDTVCVDSMLLSKQKIGVSIEEADFEKMYYTDEEGNVNLKFGEIIPEPTESDSILELIIKYEAMVDSVDVRLR